MLRLDFVRTLRELGLDLATIRRVLDQEADLPRVAGAHAEALSAQIRLLRVRRSVLRTLARRSAPTQKEVDRMNRILQATAEERRRVISEFLDSIFDGIPVDPDFRALLRRMGEGSFGPGPKVMPVGEAAKETATLVAERAGAAWQTGVDPASAEARPILDELVGAYATAVGRSDDEAYRRELLAAVHARRTRLRLVRRRPPRSAVLATPVPHPWPGMCCETLSDLHRLCQRRRAEATCASFTPAGL